MSEEQQLDTPQILNVKVVNRNDFPILDRFDNVPYVFSPNMPVSIPIDAAHHIFGWDDQISKEALLTHIQKRMGWNTPEMVKNGQHTKFSSSIEITPIIYKMVPVEVDEHGNELPQPTKSAAKMPSKMTADVLPPVPKRPGAA
jgi:hypothetical protein